MIRSILLSLLLAVSSATVWMAQAQTAQAQSSEIVVVEGQGRVMHLNRPAASVFIADPSVADVQAVSGQSLYLAGLRPGTTNIFALDFNDTLIAQYTITVIANNNDPNALLQDGGGDQVIRQSGNVAIIRGEAQSLEEALAALQADRTLQGAGRNSVNTSELAGGTQITLRVRFVEASRNDLRNIGVNLSALGTIGDTTVQVLTGNGGFLSASNAEAGSDQINATITALEQRGVVQILSEPTLTTTSGTRATFQAGGEFGYFVNQGDGVQSTEFREFGVSLDFLPVLLPNGRIALNVQPEVSFLESQIPGSPPTLSVRRADSTVEVGSGQTFAIAGLYETASRSNSSTLPGLSGSSIRDLFGGTNASRDERELVIFITPYISDAADVIDESRPSPVSVADTVGFIIE